MKAATFFFNCVLRWLFSILLLTLFFQFVPWNLFAEEQNPLYGKVRCLCVGINHYRSSDFGPLLRAESDAKTVGSIFRERYGYGVDELLGDAGTKSAILAKLDWYQQNLGSNDVLIIFFAGHGKLVELPGAGKAGYVIPADMPLSSVGAAPEQWNEAAINMEYLGNRTKTLPCRHVVLFADMCYSGCFGLRGSLSQRIDYQELIKLRSRVAVTAGTESQSAFERANMDHGYFTTALINSLNRKDPISISEMRNRICQEVSTISNGKMTPQLRPIEVDNGEFIFIPKEIKFSDYFQYIPNLLQVLAVSRGARLTDSRDLRAAFNVENRGRAENEGAFTQEWNARFERFTANAGIGDARAMAGLFFCYSEGLGTATNFSEALSWARTAFDGGIDEGKLAYGTALLNGIGIEKNELEAERILTEAGNDGIPEAWYVLASATVRNDGNLQTLRSAEGLLTKASEAKLDIASIRLARIRFGQAPFGNDDFPIPESMQNAKKGLLLLKSVSETNLPQFALENYFIRTSGEKDFPVRDEVEALKSLQNAARNGNLEAQTTLAFEYLADSDRHVTRLHLEPNPSEARKWAQLAAEAGDAEGQVLNAALLTGQSGLQPDWAKAQSLLTLAAAQNCASAFWEKGLWFQQGLCGLPQNNDSAREFFGQGAMLDPKLAFKLARVQSDYLEKLKWYRIAANREHPAAVNELIAYYFALTEDRIIWDMQSAMMDLPKNSAKRISLSKVVTASEDIGTWSTNYLFKKGNWRKVAEGCESTTIFGNFGGIGKGEFKGPARYAWSIYSAAAREGFPEAKSLVEKGKQGFFEGMARNYREKGKPKDAIWADLQALVLNTNMPIEIFNTESEKILKEFLEITDWTDLELARFAGVSLARADGRTAEQVVSSAMQNNLVYAKPSSPNVKVFSTANGRWLLIMPRLMAAHYPNDPTFRSVLDQIGKFQFYENLPAVK